MAQIMYVGNVEFHTTNFDMKLELLIDKKLLIATKKSDNCAFLRDHDDYEQFSLKLVRSNRNYISQIGFRASSKKSLIEIHKNIKNSKYKSNLLFGECNETRLRFKDPKSRIFEIYFNEDCPQQVRKIGNERLNFLGLVQLVSENVEEYAKFVSTCLGLTVRTYPNSDDGKLKSCWFSINNNCTKLRCLNDEGTNQTDLVTYDCQTKMVRIHNFTISKTIYSDPKLN